MCTHLLVAVPYLLSTVGIAVPPLDKVPPRTTSILARAHPLIVILRALDLVVVDRDPRHVRAAGGCDGPHRPADAAAHVQGSGPGLEPQDACQPRLVRRLGRSPAQVATGNRATLRPRSTSCLPALITRPAADSL